MANLHQLIRIIPPTSLSSTLFYIIHTITTIFPLIISNLNNNYYMKKTFYLMGLLLLSLTMSLTSCNNKDSAPENEGNSIVLGDDMYNITSALCTVDNPESEVDLTFYCSDLSLSIELKGEKELAVGVYELTREGRYTGEIDFYSSDRDYDATGTLAISIDETGSIYTITLSGEAFKDRGGRYLSLVYQGELSK